MAKIPLSRTHPDVAFDLETEAVRNALTIGADPNSQLRAAA
jgi:hypothetical protein